MTGNARSSMKGVGMAARTSPPAGPPDRVNASRAKSVRGNAIRELKKRGDFANFVHIGRVYLVIIVAISCAIWSYGVVASAGLGWWWNIPATLVAIVVIGASQHQFGGVIHEGTHFILFDNKKLNELMSDWLAAFPIYTSTFQFRLHHLAHHQFINDPVRDPDCAQLHDSGHDLDFPITHFEMLRALLKQLWLPNLFRYMMVRARYSSLGTGNNPYLDQEHRGERLPTLAGIMYAVGVPAAVIPLVDIGHGAWAFAVLGILTAITIIYFARLDENKLPHAHVETVDFAPDNQHQPHCLHGHHLRGDDGHRGRRLGAGLGTDYGVLWVIPLFTTFPLFMIMRQWVQHGNADRGRYTNTRVFLVNPFIRYAIFPFGMDYHLPHHVYASVPHFKLKGLHELLLQDPDYREKGVVVEGYFNSPHGETGARNPTVMEVLGEKYAPRPDGEVYIDTETLEYANVKNPEAIARQNEASVRGG